MNPRMERAMWGLEKNSHMVRKLMQTQAKLRLRMEVHMSLSETHAKSALVAYSFDYGYAAELHVTAAQRHMGAASWMMGALRQRLTPVEMKHELSLVDDAVNIGLKAVEETKKAMTKKVLDDDAGR